MLNPFNAGLGRDIKILITSMGIVSLAGGFNQVVQLVYLAMLGISPSLIGIVVSIATVGGAVRMVLFGALSDKFGRRRILFVMGFTSVVFNLIYFFARDYPFFILAAIIGGVGTEGFGGSVEWSYLAEKAGDHKRTIAFISEKDLEKIGYNPIEIAKLELEKDVLPITVKRPLPAKRAQKAAEKAKMA